MITRLYANNFRCLVAFEAAFDSFGVLCGPNGAGKSSVFDAIGLLRSLGTGDGLLGGTGEMDVPRLEFTRWTGDTKKESTIQEFELGLSVEGHAFEYLLHLEQKADFEKPRVFREKATCDGKALFERELDPKTLRAEVRFHRADGIQTSFPLDWRQSALAAIQPRGGIEKLSLLQEEIARLLILRPNPRSMERESKAKAKHPDLSMGNLTSWYRSLAQEQEWTDSLREMLREVWPDFRSFKLVDVGLNTEALQLRFESEDRKPILLFFDQLSDGERSLIGLYMLRAALETGAAKTVLIDEPDNFVGLPELQPWVLSMRELLDEKHQLILISHHPEVLSNSGEANGRYLWRDNHTSPTRIGPLQVPEGMTAGEAIARGWARGR
jgi:predicted ATPase